MLLLARPAYESDGSRVLEELGKESRGVFSMSLEIQLDLYIRYGLLRVVS